MVDTNDIATILGSILASILGIFTWLSGMQFLTASIAAVTGAFLTIYFNSRMQKRAWKREVTIKKMNEIFGPLYLDVGKTLQNFSIDNLGFSWYRSDEWQKIREHYHYRLLRSTDKDLTNKLENFYAVAEQVGHLGSDVVDLASRVLLKYVREKMGADIVSAGWQFYGVREGRSQGNLSFQELRAVINGRDPIEMLMQIYDRIDAIQARIGLQRRGSNEVPYQDIDVQAAREIFAKAAKELSENEKLKALKNDTLELIRLGTEVRDRLGKMIDEPWKV